MDFIYNSEAVELVQGVALGGGRRLRFKHWELNLCNFFQLQNMTILFIHHPSHFFLVGED